MNDENIAIRWAEFTELLRSTKREGIEELITYMEKETDFRTAPASTRYHLNIRGGLLEHSLNVYHTLNDDFKTDIELFKIPNESIILVSLLHDLCKANYYSVSSRNVKDEKTGEWHKEPFYEVDDWLPLRHAEKSVIITQIYIKLNKLEILMMSGHMGFANTPQYEVQISDLFSRCPQALLLNFADLKSTYMIENNKVGKHSFEEGYRNLFPRKKLNIK